MVLTVCANPSVDSFWSIGEITKGNTNRSKGETFYPGGKGIHVAFALQELGESVTTLGIWGGMTGRWLKEQCENKNIETTGPLVDDWTRICITNRTDSSWNETELLGAGPSLKPQVTNDFISEYQKQLKKNDIDSIVISGSVPGGFDTDLYQQLITIARWFEIPAYIDASGVLLENALEATPHVIHTNHHEGHEISGFDDPLEITRWLLQHCTIAAVTAGADGLYLGTNKDIYHAQYSIDDSDIISTIGSGDCLLAGLCKAILSQKSPEGYAKLATACGSANCIHPKLGMFDKADVNKIFNEVTVQKL